MSELEEVAEPYLVADASGEITPSERATLCMGCGKFVEDRFSQFFMTTYPGGDERRDFWGILHEDCRGPSWLERLLSNADRRSPGRLAMPAQT